MELSRLLERLGAAIDASDVDSEKMAICLNELRRNGWDAVTFLEAALGSRSAQSTGPVQGAFRMRAGSTHGESDYRLCSDDARWLASVGISPTRHRSHSQRPLPPLYQLLPPARGEG
jgi:hypothetical protein